MKLVVDMNLSPRWVQVLNDAGLQATHWSTIGPFNATDAEIMAYAAANECVVLTHDLDFSAILAATRDDRPSVVQLRADDVSPTAIGPHVVAALQQMASELARGALLTVDTARARMRLLPLRSGG